MVEYAPQAIRDLFNTVQAVIPQAVLSGILGDAAHTYGYHRGRNYVASSDYSVQLPPDKLGDGEAASALDISWSDPNWQYKVSQRLWDAKNDPRMKCVREFFGSLDGIIVIGWDYYGGYQVTSDTSHLWHVHISILREYSNDGVALQDVANVLTAETGEDWLAMATMQDVENAVRNVLNEGTGYGQQNWKGTNQTAYNRQGDIINKLALMQTQLNAIQQEVTKP